MFRKMIGAAAACALMAGGAALAQTASDYGSTTTDERTAPQEGVGGSGSAGSTTGSSSSGKSTTGSSSTTGSGSAGMGASDTASTGSSMSPQELVGRVVKNDGKTIYIESQEGAIVPISITSETQFADASVKKAKDLQPGQEVRASLRIENRTKNIATMVSLASPTSIGGSGAKDPSGSSGSGSYHGGSSSGMGTGSGTSGGTTTPPPTTPPPTKSPSTTTPGSGGSGGSMDPSSGSGGSGSAGSDIPVDSKGSLDSMNQNGTAPYDSSSQTR